MVGPPRSEDCMCEITLGSEPRVITVRVPITIPSSICHFELAHRLVQHHNIPIYLHNGMNIIYFLGFMKIASVRIYLDFSFPWICKEQHILLHTVIEIVYVFQKFRCHQTEYCYAFINL